MHCEKHGIDYEQQTQELFGKSITFGTCPLCDKESDEKRAQMEAQEEREALISRWKRSGIEELYYSATLENYTIETDEQRKAVETVKRMIASKSGKIVMLGKNGTGKTHLAVCAVKALGGKIKTMYEISAEIRGTYKDKSPIEEIDYVDDLARVPFLVIDEIGRTKGSDAETNWLSYIIDKRNSRNLPLMLISNKHARKTCAKNGCPDCLENYLSEDIMSRLNTDGVLLHFTGDDFRARLRRTTRERSAE